jgi:hypothetical protein
MPWLLNSNRSWTLREAKFAVVLIPFQFGSSNAFNVRRARPSSLALLGLIWVENGPMGGLPERSASSSPMATPSPTLCPNSL